MEQLPYSTLVPGEVAHYHRRCAYGAWHTSFPITAAVSQFVTLQNTPFLYLGETVVYFIQGCLPHKSY